MNNLPLLIILSLILGGCIVKTEHNQQAIQSVTHSQQALLAQLGAQLYFDQNLSKYRNQSCASCHDPKMGFIDPRDNGVFGAVSLGSDGVSLGDRNAPTAAYAALSPLFHRNQMGEYIGGQFYDGRASSLADQAAGPPNNPIEMGLTTKSMVVDRIQENPLYVNQFQQMFGQDIFSNSDAAYRSMSESIMAFEKTALFMPFDSKYDRMLKGEATFTAQEELGRTLFFSQQFTNCNACHQINKSPFYPRETFSNYKYHNIGVPENALVRQVKGAVAKDIGLLANPNVTQQTEEGKFKVPTLRNIAITAPYMHNGVFKELDTVIKFYDKYNNASRTINPETGKAWQPPEVATTVNINELEKGPALTDQRVDALVAFLKTLTDRRYEYLLEQ